MTILLDTPTQRATHSALHGYAADVTTNNEAGALRKRDELAELRKTERRIIAERDQYVAAMHLEDGMSAPEIARRLDMSISNARLICDRAKLLQQQRPAHQQP